VNRAHAKADACVSQRVAEQMAIGVCKAFGTRLGIATTGYAEPVPKSGIHQPFAWWAVCDRRGRRPIVFSGLAELSGFDRESAQQAVAQIALDALVEHLKGS
jgi:nicotinamide mononucleotide (NMN) deamidase PncC